MYGSNAGQPAPSLYTKGLPPLCDMDIRNTGLSHFQPLPESSCNWSYPCAKLYFLLCKGLYLHMEQAMINSDGPCSWLHLKDALDARAESMYQRVSRLSKLLFSLSQFAYQQTVSTTGHNLHTNSLHFRLSSILCYK